MPIYGQNIKSIKLFHALDALSLNKFGQAFVVLVASPVRTD